MQVEAAFGGLRRGTPILLPHGTDGVTEVAEGPVGPQQPMILQAQTFAALHAWSAPVPSGIQAHVWHSY